LPRHKFTEEERKRGNQYEKGGQKAVIDGTKGGINKGVNSPARNDMHTLASLIANAPIKSVKTKDQLKKIGIEAPENLTNQAVVVAAVYMAAASGDMKAVEKWQELTEKLEKGDDGSVRIVIDV
jgi:hypothetical protein